jgi:hydrogenase nickel incorporation protein HypA/HybF
VHERALVDDLIRKAAEVAAMQGATRVVGMRVRVGPLSHIDPVTLPALLADAAGGTPVDGAQVEVVAGPDDVDDPEAQDVVLEIVRVEG